MTLAPRSRTPRPWRPRSRPEFAAAVSAAAALLVQLVAGWPGWMTPQSVGQWLEARSGPFTDAHPTALTWFWAQMDPAAHGPLVPFLLQVVLFWFGVALLAIGLQPAAAWTRLLPLVVLVCPVSWLIVTVSPAAAVAAVVAVALGVASLGLRAFRAGRPTNGTVALRAAAVIMGFAALGGGVLAFALLPLLMLLTAALVLAAVPARLGRRARFEAGAKAAVLTLIAGLVATVILPVLLIGTVGQTRSHEALYALDAFHVDCAPTWSTGRISTEPVSPPGLWIAASAPCNTGGPGDFGTGWAGAADPASPQVLGFGQWLGIVAQHPSVVIGGRLQHAAALAASPLPWAPDLSGGELVAAPAAGGVGDAAGYPSRGGVLVTMYAAVTSLLPGTLLLWALVAPAGVAVWRVHRVRQGKDAGNIPVLPLLLWPPMAALALGMVSPFQDPAVLAPAALLGWLIALWGVGLTGARMPARDVEQIRRAGPYPGRPPAAASGAPEQDAGPQPADAVQRPQPRPARRRVRVPALRVPQMPRRQAAADDLGPSPLSDYVAQHAEDFQADRDRQPERDAVPQR